MELDENLVFLNLAREKLKEDCMRKNKPSSGEKYICKMKTSILPESS